MSVQTLYTAATGMEALQHKLDTISNNMANINTTSFKRDRANFEDLFYRQETLPGALDASGNPTAVGVHTGLGAKIESTQIDFKQGAFQQTGKQLDLAIEGAGFFKVIDPASSEVMYTRAGNFSLNASNQLVVGSAETGRLVEPAITIPPESTGIVVSSQGVVQYSQAGTQTLTTAGTIELAQFSNPEGLLKRGENLYSETPASGSAITNTPGTNGTGVIRQGALEASNVEPVQELIDLITTQRAFELNSQCVQAGDQIMQQIANLRRF